jgi:hypothetical protein
LDGHDDLANAVAGCLVQLDLDRRPPLVKIEDVAGAVGSDAAEPRWCEYTYMVLADAGPDIAVVFCGSIRDDHERGIRQTLYVLDLDVIYFRPGLFRELIKRLGELGAKWHVGRMAVFAPEHLAVQLAGFGLRVEALAPGFEAEHWVTLAAEYISRGKVRFCAPVTSKMQTRTIGAALALKAGDPVETALRAALIVAIWLKHASA